MVRKAAFKYVLKADREGYAVLQMGRFIAMDESGNTQAVCAFCLVSIPQKEIDRISEILTVKPSDAPEIITLWQKVCREEFKYSAFRQAFRTTGLEIYDSYLREKLIRIGQLKIQVYFSVFPNHSENNLRIGRLYDEASFLIHAWAQQNQADALDRSLNIVVDQQVFPEKMLFSCYLRRGRFKAMLMPKSNYAPALESGALHKIAADRENMVDVEQVNSRSYARIQLSDMIVGCIREHYAQGVEGYFPLLKPLIYKKNCRIQLSGYVPPAMQSYDLNPPSGI